VSYRSESDLLALARLAYTAAMEPAGWTAFLERYQRAMAGACVTVMHADLQTRDSFISTAIGDVADELVLGYNTYYGARNPLIRRRTEPMQPGGVTLSHVEYPFEKFLETEFYRDYCRRLDLGCVIRTWIIETVGTSTSICSLRSVRAGVYGNEDVRFLQPLVPHLQRALQMHVRLRELRLDGQTEAGALDRLALGVFVVSPAGRVLVANARGQRLLAARDGLTLHDDGLRAAGGTETKRLRALARAAARSARGESMHAGGVLRLARPSGAAPLSVLIAPAAPALAYPILPPGCLTMLVQDPDDRPDPQTLLARLYKLTPAEARVADRLLRGHTVEACAEALAITRETARTHVRSIFRKSRTHRQADFVRRTRSSLASQLRVGGDPLRSEE
jgi:DNA-binding CsgD family transcriptional regulator